VSDVQIDGVDEEMVRFIRFADDVQTTFSGVGNSRDMSPIVERQWLSSYR
jgi:hypothetical protein